jgi:hypothetical protein
VRFHGVHKYERSQTYRSDCSCKHATGCTAMEERDFEREFLLHFHGCEHIHIEKSHTYTRTYGTALTALLRVHDAVMTAALSKDQLHHHSHYGGRRNDSHRGRAGRYQRALDRRLYVPMCASCERT